MLQEPTSYEEVEVENYSTYPSVTLCPQKISNDNFSTFDDVMKEIAVLEENTGAVLRIQESRKYLDLKIASTLLTEFNSSTDYVWEYSAVLQHQFENAIIPCVTMNFPPQKMSNQETFNLQISVKNPSHNHYYTTHEYRQLRHNYQIEQSESYQMLKKKTGFTEYFMQTETTQLKKSRFECFEDNSMYFKDCIDDFIAEQIGCRLPWTTRQSKFKKVCQSHQDLKAFRNLSFSMNNLMSESQEIKNKITDKGCFKPNCRQRTWTKNQFFERWYEPDKTFLSMIIPPGAKVLQRKEVLLANLSTFVADCGSYLGLFLGGSILTLVDFFIAFIKKINETAKLNCSKA